MPACSKASPTSTGRSSGSTAKCRSSAHPAVPCYRCLYPEPPPADLVPNCAEGGVLGVLAGIVGTWQASEALKLILGIGTPLVGRLVLIDALDARVREVRIARDPACPLCGDAPRPARRERPSRRARRSSRDRSRSRRPISTRCCATRSARAAARRARAARGGARRAAGAS